jgi:rhodanese-related sulfurtransferase
MPSNITAVTPAPSAEALRHFEARLAFETDCWDVHDAFARSEVDFLLVDVRSPALFATSHIPHAINIPHGKMIESYMAKYPMETVFVVYCAGPHCNGANKAAVRLARLGRPVKELIGGMTGWADEGFAYA